MAAPCAASNESESNSPEPSRGWKILHVDVARLEAIALEPGYEGLYLCFWHDRRPLGHHELYKSELPLSEIQMRHIAAHAIAPAVRAGLRNSDPAELINGSGTLRRLSEIWRQETASFKAQAVSVVICTRDRPKHLRRCLESIARLRFPPEEIIVVDNGNQREETRRVTEAFEKVRYVVEPRPGLSRARNTGVRATACQLVAFTDDDIVVGDDWLFHLVTALQDPGVAGATGLVFAAELRTEAHIAFEHGFGGFHQGYVPRRYGPEFVRNTRRKAAAVWSICAGGNMIVRRSLFDSTGLFDERLGAGAAGCSEDSEFWYRVLANGGTCAYTPAAVVSHHHREDLESLGQQIYFYMRGHVSALLVQYQRFGRWSDLHRIFVELPVYYGECWLRHLLGGEENRLILRRSVRGALAGIWYWIRHSRREAT
jgi:GT2 family glycosyltransferase